VIDPNWLPTLHVAFKTYMVHLEIKFSIRLYENNFTMKIVLPIEIPIACTQMQLFRLKQCLYSNRFFLTLIFHIIVLFVTPYTCIYIFFALHV